MKNLFSQWSSSLAWLMSIPAHLFLATFTNPLYPIILLILSGAAEGLTLLKHAEHPRPLKLLPSWSGMLFLQLAMDGSFIFFKPLFQKSPWNHFDAQLLSKLSFHLIFLFHPFTTRHTACGSVRLSFIALTCNSRLYLQHSTHWLWVE